MGKIVSDITFTDISTDVVVDSSFSNLDTNPNGVNVGMIDIPSPLWYGKGMYLRTNKIVNT